MNYLDQVINIDGNEIYYISVDIKKSQQELNQWLDTTRQNTFAQSTRVYPLVNHYFFNKISIQCDDTVARDKDHLIFIVTFTHDTTGASAFTIIRVVVGEDLDSFKSPDETFKDILNTMIKKILFKLDIYFFKTTDKISILPGDDVTNINVAMNSITIERLSPSKLVTIPDDFNQFNNSQNPLNNPPLPFPQSPGPVKQINVSNRNIVTTLGQLLMAYVT